MTRTLEFSPEMEARLQVLAAQRGATVEVMALQAVEAWLWDEDMEAALDAQDVAELRAAPQAAPQEDGPDVLWSDIKAELNLWPKSLARPVW